MNTQSFKKLDSFLCTIVKSIWTCDMAFLFIELLEYLQSRFIDIYWQRIWTMNSFLLFFFKSLFQVCVVTAEEEEKKDGNFFFSFLEDIQLFSLITHIEFV